ncbi:MAG: hypothetical protein JSU87_07050 [Gemmatimonadota bacterium]|nr:MAG: hypothetical protein JSU87_07050 [Gemmatimonadota bacterium]
MFLPFGSLDGFSYVTLGVSAAIPILLGVALLLVQKTIADRLAPCEVPAESGPACDGRLEALLAVAGVYFVVEALVEGAAVASGDHLRAEFLRDLSALLSW